MENDRRSAPRPGPYRPSEVEDGSRLDEHDVVATFAIARELERVAIEGVRGPGGRLDSSFVDRVMASIATEPLPAPMVALRSSRDGSAIVRLTGIAAAARDAFRVAFGPGRPSAVRAPALAMVAVLVTVVGLGAVVGASLLGDLRGAGPNANLPGVGGMPSPSVEPSPVPAPSSAPQVVISPTPGVMPAASHKAASSPTSTSRPTAPTHATPQPNPTVRPTDRPTATPTASPRPTPHPTETPDGSHSAEPTGTPEPTSMPESSSGGG